ncbi:MAG: dTDP-4-dehydrorhamnose 3,5-epimerase [Bacteroidales bacterium]|jgi:dTDP-4-dehydrorhamnose 3,5-epimerase|nr:dTDP-4-dehydrorhamnose 3,5-epimerase [Bacteroidales bacterium]
MQLTITPLEGLVILKPAIYYDNRGYFFESYHKNTFQDLGIDAVFVQENQSCSSKGVIRGLHFQNPPHAQAKLVRVVKGSVMDVAVDLRKNSSTYGQHFSVELSDQNHLLFYLPIGFAHGFIALEEETIFNYLCTDFYHKESEGAIRFDDPILNINWNNPTPLVNEKDLQGVSFLNFKSMF